MSIAFFALAAFFNAVMDTLLWHFDKSVFRNLKKEWWNPNYSWMSVKPILGTRLDAWHLAKYGMLICFVGSVVTYQPLLGWYDFALYFLIWWVVFELFYGKLLNDKI